MSIKLSGKCLDGKDGYDGGGARKSVHGYVCQLNLCALSFLRAYRSGYTFQLGSEDSEVKDYDDMILKYKGDDGREIRLYLQSKHIQNCGDKALTARHLLRGEGDSGWKDDRFLISKYYESYLKNEIQSEEHYFIIYTNMGLDIDDMAKAGINAVPLSPENFSRFFRINSDGNGNCYKLFVDENQPFFEKLFSLSDVYKVAHELVEVIKDQKRLEMRNPVLKKYKHFLGYRVLEECAGDEKKRRFADEFISCETLPPNSKTFRNTFKKLYYEAIKPNYQFECEDAFRDDLRGRRVEVSRSFRDLDKEKIVEFPDPSQCIKRFFNEFVLAVKQPNEAELEDIIKKEIELIFSTKDTDLIVPVIQSDMLDWMKKRTGTWLTRDDMESFIQRIKRDMGTLMIRGISLECQNELSRMNCIIQPEELENDITVQAIRNFLPGKCEIMFLRSNQSLLTFLKVHQSIIWMKENKIFKCLEKDDDIIFLSLRCLTSSERVRNDLKEKNIFNLMVSHVEETVLNEEASHEYLKDLLNLVVSNQRKLILVFQEIAFKSIDNITKEMGCEDRVFKNPNIILDKTLSFLQLDATSQNQLLQLEVVDFQGKITNLSSLSPDIESIIDEEILLSLVQKAPIRLGKLDSEIEFLDQYKARQLSLVHSSSMVSNEITIPTFISEDELLSDEHGKVLIISGEPRTGKSWLVSSLLEKMKKKFPDTWVLKIDLNSCAEICSKMALYTTLHEQYSFAEDIDKTMEFIIDKILMGTSNSVITSKFEKEVLKLGFRGKIKLVFLIDGFSDLCKDGSRFVLQLLKGTLQTNVEKLFVTSRPENYSDLKCLDGKYFYLDSLEGNQSPVLIKLNSDIRLPENLNDTYKLLRERLIGKGLGNISEELQGIMSRVGGELARATDGNYSSAQSPQTVLNALSYIIKERWGVTTRFK